LVKLTKIEGNSAFGKINKKLKGTLRLVKLTKIEGNSAFGKINKN